MFEEVEENCNAKRVKLGETSRLVIIREVERSEGKGVMVFETGPGKKKAKKVGIKFE